MKKNLSLIIAGTVGAFFGLVQFAFATSSTIQLPAGFGASILDNTNGTLLGLNDYTVLIIGVLLAVTIIVTIIETIKS